MVSRRGSESGTTMRGPGDISLEINPTITVDVFSASVPIETVVDDTVYITADATLLERSFTINPVLTTTLPNTGVSWRSLDEGIATIDSSGIVTRVSDGRAKIIVESHDIQSYYTQGVRLEPQDDAINNEFDRFADGSIGRHCELQIDTRISGEDPDVARDMFSSLDAESRTFTRAVGCWGADIDLTPLSVWNTYTSWGRSPTLINPLFVLHAAHGGHPRIGDTLYFSDADSNSVSGTIVDEQSYADLLLSKLDAPIPSSIGYAKCLPTGWESYLPTNGRTMPICYANQFKELNVLEVTDLVSDIYANTIIFGNPVDAGTRRDFSENVVQGDSSAGVCAVVNNELVYLGGVTNQWQATCIASPTVFNWIIDAMADMSGTGDPADSSYYTLTTIDMDGFNTY